MINTKQDLKEYLKEDLAYYYSQKNNIIKRFKSIVSCDNEYCVYNYIVTLRKSEYYLSVFRNSHNSLFKRILFRIKYLIAHRKKNRLGIKYGIEISENTFEKGLTIYHTGGIVINSNSRIGKNCKLHGDNCIGNKGVENSKSPRIGNNVSLGVGAKVIGDISIADNIIIAAGAVVTKSFTEPNIILAGVPAIDKGKCNELP